MFEGFSSGLLPGWVAPSLEPGEVAGQAVRAVLSGEGQVSWALGQGKPAKLGMRPEADGQAFRGVASTSSLRRTPSCSRSCGRCRRGSTTSLSSQSRLSPFIVFVSF